jgi:hypothetical protein
VGFAEVVDQAAGRKTLQGFLGEILVVVVGVENGQEKLQIDTFLGTDLFDGRISKTKVYVETVDDRDKVMVMVQHICQFHFFLNEHAPGIDQFGAKISNLSQTGFYMITYI